MPQNYLIIAALIAVSLSTFAGCDKSKPVRVDNPVVGPPPPRVTPTDLKIDQQNYAQLDKISGATKTEPPVVQTVSSSSAKAKPGALDDAQIVATVNGFPILAGDVLERYGMQLKQMKGQLTPAQFQETRHKLIVRDLPGHIERALLVQTLKSQIENEQMENVNAQLDSLFEAEVLKMMERTGSITSHELNQKLKEQGTSLEQLRSAFGTQQLAMQFIALEAREEKIFSRSELLEYYRDHIDDYTNPARVKWQEFIVYFKQHGGKSGAAEVVKKAIRELQAGTDFADVARDLSDGATAQQGGVWDWVQKESIADEVLKEKLFTLNEGEISEVIVKPNAFQIARVIDREEKNATPFEELHDEIGKKLKAESQNAATKEVLSKLKETATIEILIETEQPIEI